MLAGETESHDYLQRTTGCPRGTVLPMAAYLCAEVTTLDAAAMMAAVATGVYSSMDDCIADWVTPLLGDVEKPDAQETARFDRLFAAYVDIRTAMPPAWDRLATATTRLPDGA